MNHLTVGCLVARPLEKVQTKSDVTLVIIPVFLNCKLLLYRADNFLLSIDHEGTHSFSPLQNLDSYAYNSDNEHYRKILVYHIIIVVGGQKD